MKWIMAPRRFGLRLFLGRPWFWLLVSSGALLWLSGCRVLPGTGAPGGAPPAWSGHVRTLPGRRAQPVRVKTSRRAPESGRRRPASFRRESRERPAAAAAVIAGPAAGPARAPKAWALFQAELTRSRQLGAGVILVLGGRDALRKTRAVFVQDSTGRSPVILPPSGWGAGAASSTAGPAGPLTMKFGGVRWLLADSAFLDNSARHGAASVYWRNLAGGLRKVPPDRPLVVALTGGRGAPAPAFWMLLAGRSARTVVFHRGLRTSWRRRPGGVDEFTLAPAREESVGDFDTAVREGEGPGFFWVNGAQPDVPVLFLALAGAFSPAEIAWEDQASRRAIRASLTATPLVPPESVTEIVCRNPSHQVLHYVPAWQFSRDGIRVDPQVLGFDLNPGEVFRQRFRITDPSGTPLRFSQPTFVLSTRYRDRDGMTTGISAEVRPWCVMPGVFGELRAAPRIDGRLGEWNGGGMLLNHESQIVRGRSVWKGPADLSARVFAGYFGRVFYSAVRVRDDSVLDDIARGGAAEYVDFYLAPMGDGNRPPYHLRVSLDGSVTQEHGAGGPGVVARVRREKSGFSVEIGVPFTVFLGSSTVPDRLRFDVGITEQDAGDAGPVCLFFSGDPGDANSAERLGVLERQALPGPPSP